MSTKLLSDVYTKEEEDILKDFCDFLVSHLKYMETYEKIQELNLSLDKKVDQKTMMYNNLLNKQTDFIAMASHEIKNPL
jgi:signal transduction histidine kinase